MYRILIVEDDMDIAHAIKKAFRSVEFTGAVRGEFCRCNDRVFCI